MRETLCWGCVKCVGYCSWSYEGKPVKGWNAEKTIIPNNGGRKTPSYLVLDCPEFKMDKKLISKTAVAKLLGLSKSTVGRWDPDYLLKRAKEIGLNLAFDQGNNCYYEIG